MQKLPEEKIKMIENNIDKFLAGEITLTAIAELIDVKKRNTVSKYMQQLLVDKPEKLEEFKIMTDKSTMQRAKYIKIYTTPIKANFDKILSGEITKKELANSLGIDQMTLGSLIEEIYRNELYKIEEYETVKGENRRGGGRYTRAHKEKNAKRTALKNDERKISRLDYMRLTRDENIEWIMYKANKRQANCKEANLMTESEIKGSIEEVIEYFLTKRNNRMSEQKNNFDEEIIFEMLFENPGILSPGQDKKERIFDYLDNNSDIGINDANYIAMKYPGVLTAALERTASQVMIAQDLGILDRFIKNPKRFIPAPKTVYALAMSAKEKGISDISIGRTPLFNKYGGLTYEDLYEQYPLPDKYNITPAEIARNNFIKRMGIAKTPTVNSQPNSKLAERKNKIR